MTAADYSAVFAIWLLGVISPGPDAMLVTRQVMRGGRARGIEAALGIATGVGVWVVVASIAGAALTEGSGRFVAALELAGGAYLVWLGVGSMRAPGGGPSPVRPEADEAEAAAVRRGPSSSFLVGLITNLLNPKALLFFGAIFTAIVPAAATTADRVVIGVVFVISEAAWFCSVAVFVGRATSGAGAQHWRRRIDLASGTLFLVLGTVAVTRGLQGLG
ncbi:MAG: LysE family translocator [Solirubrobacteraceae bacterium]|nr:LysE family translocator [Solirubrobacteraceae bacterium]